MTAFYRSALAACAAFAATAIVSASGAGAMTFGTHVLAGSHSALVRAHYDRWDGQHYYRHARYYRGYYRDNVVDAPFTHVETGRHVIVDAPFTHVYVGPRGRHIVAPFVDLWVPY